MSELGTEPSARSEGFEPPTFRSVVAKGVCLMRS